MQKLVCLFGLLFSLLMMEVGGESGPTLEEVWEGIGDNRFELEAFREESFRQFELEGEKAFDSLVKGGMPLSDKKTLSSRFLMSNLIFAMKARVEFPWSEQVSEEMFFNEVLPYAILDEVREDWRPQFYEICSNLVKGCETASEAAQVLNRDLFDRVKVHYHRGRKKPNQSPSESMETGKATCTGLSIILAYGCRSVGIPARLVGTALWSDKSGNHTWVEIWDGEWKYLGADEYDKKGLNRSWFGGRASQAQKDKWQHAIWATSWKRVDGHFPMVWAQENQSVGAVNVTDRYAKKEATSSSKKLGIRVFESEGKKRVVAKVTLLDERGEPGEAVATKAGQADMNDVAQLSLSGSGPWRLLVTAGELQQEVVVKERPEQALDVILGEARDVKLDLAQAVATWRAEGREARERELKEKVIEIGDKKLRFLEKKFGKEPASGHCLWISMHGGGQTKAQVNDQQWQNQIQLYQPAEGYVVAPRAPTDTWNLWHQSHIDGLFDRLIANYVICRGVDPNRIYLMGYSAGGDGVYQLAPRMADRFAAAAMMAGHPNETKADGLRNLSFEIFMGEKDGAYNRNKKAENWKRHLAQFQSEDPEGYRHRVTIYPGLGHWMKGKEAEVLPRMIQVSRREWPKRVVWFQDDVTHERFYWLGVKPEGAVKKRKLIAEVEGQTISVEGESVNGLQFWLNDQLLDLDREIVVKLNGKESFRGKVKRKGEVVAKSIRQRCGMIATALLEL